MKRIEDLRKLLREADPAKEQELPPLERARMRSGLLAEASRHVPRPRTLPVFAMATLVTAVVLALIVLRPHARPPVTATATTNATVENAVPPVAARPMAELPKAMRPGGARVAPLPARAVATRPRPPLARSDVDSARLTRIVFTGPAGTRILWFVGTPDAKELGS